MEKKVIHKSATRVDYVVLEEVGEVVKFESMNLVDKLLLTNSHQKMVQLEKVKKHKHVVFDETPTIIEYPKKSTPATPGENMIITTTSQTQSKSLFT